MSRKRTALALAVLLAACSAGAACSSPEAARTRGGGSGSDVGNRPGTVKMHEGSRQFWKTPQRLEFAHAPIEPSQQAREMSRR